MVRAGVVTNTAQWQWCGYSVIQSQPKRYKIIDTDALKILFNIQKYNAFQVLHKGWLDNKLQEVSLKRETVWSKSLAISNELYIIKIN